MLGYRHNQDRIAVRLGQIAPEDPVRPRRAVLGVRLEELVAMRGGFPRNSWVLSPGCRGFCANLPSADRTAFQRTAELASVSRARSCAAAWGVNWSWGTVRQRLRRRQRTARNSPSTSAFPRDHSSTLLPRLRLRRATASQRTRDRAQSHALRVEGEHHPKGPRALVARAYSENALAHGSGPSPVSSQRRYASVCFASSSLASHSTPQPILHRT